MIPFKEYNDRQMLAESKFQELNESNLHSTHYEDSALYAGVNGVKDAIMLVQSLRDTLGSKTKSNTVTTVKVDGSPALFAGIDPVDGKFFVSMKNLFNKTPVMYKTPEDIKNSGKVGDLQIKLNYALEEFKKLGIKDILQGDVMFTKEDIEKHNIDGTDYLTFHPNTIVYAVPADSDLGRQIKKAKIGIVWHTGYSGPDVQNLATTHAIDISGLKNVSTVWSQDAYIKNIDKATFTDTETKTIDKLISEMTSKLKKIDSNTMKELQSDRVFAGTLETYNNSFVRAGKTVKPSVHVKGLIEWATERFEKDIAKKKSDKGKAGARAKMEKYLSFFSDTNKKNLTLIYELQSAMVEAKLMMIAKLSELQQLKTFVRDKNGFRVTAEEGFVISDTLKGGNLKLVDRLTFSRLNFTDPSEVGGVLKGWMKI